MAVTGYLTREQAEALMAVGKEEVARAERQREQARLAQEAARNVRGGNGRPRREAEAERRAAAEDKERKRRETRTAVASGERVSGLW